MDGVVHAWLGKVRANEIRLGSTLRMFRAPSIRASPAMARAREDGSGIGVMTMYPSRPMVDPVSAICP